MGLLQSPLLKRIPSRNLRKQPRSLFQYRIPSFQVDSSTHWFITTFTHSGLYYLPDALYKPILVVFLYTHFLSTSDYSRNRWYNAYRNLGFSDMFILVGPSVCGSYVVLALKLVAKHVWKTPPESGVQALVLIWHDGDWNFMSPNYLFRNSSIEGLSLIIKYE